ncbi:hypothetical protein AURDEDRAFT_164456 [Auricularia subglabra TFB-10046 SS5]|nr:hypothetical protein AURDEDRAFT_164456 [Auricularia subglabra TFB-10046 SS5]
MPRQQLTSVHPNAEYLSQHEHAERALTAELHVIREKLNKNLALADPVFSQSTTTHDVTSSSELLALISKEVGDALTRAQTLRARLPKVIKAIVFAHADKLRTCGSDRRGPEIPSKPEERHFAEDFFYDGSNPSSWSWELSRIFLRSFTRDYSVPSCYELRDIVQAFHAYRGFRKHVLRCETGRRAPNKRSSLSQPTKHPECTLKAALLVTVERLERPTDPRVSAQPNYDGPGTPVAPAALHAAAASLPVAPGSLVTAASPIQLIESDPQGAQIAMLHGRIYDLLAVDTAGTGVDPVFLPEGTQHGSLAAAI